MGASSDGSDHPNRRRVRHRRCCRRGARRRGDRHRHSPSVDRRCATARTLNPKMSQPADPYAVLGIARTADAVTIRAAYRLRALEYHPDRPGGSTVRMQAITHAYAILADVASRAAWDLSAARPVNAQRPPSRPPSGPASSATPGSAWRRASEAHAASAAAARQSRGTLPATAASRLTQWSAVAVVLTGIQGLTIGGGDVLLALAATVLAVRVFVRCRSGREPFWPGRDAGSVLRTLVAVAAASFRQRPTAR